MKKQTKLAVIISAAALLALSALPTFAKGWVQNNGKWFYENASGEYVTEKIESSGNSKFYLGSDGAMVTDTFVEDYNSNGYSYYFGSNGAMVTNTWVAIDPSIVSNAGDNAPSAYWYYFGANGKCYKAAAGKVAKKTIDGKKYMFDEYGKMMTGWFDDAGSSQNDEDNPFEAAVYYAGAENDGVLRTGWLAYYDGTDKDGYDDKDVLWFYFDTSNHKKKAGGEKTINGKKYTFETDGIMKSKWVYTTATETNAKGTKVQANVYKYYSKDTDGHLVKKGWIYEVPEAYQDAGKHDDDEEYWFYANTSGELNKGNIKKINGKYYAFDGSGIMQKGLVVFNNGTYVATIDLEKTNVDDMLKTNKAYLKKTHYTSVDERPEGVDKCGVNSTYYDVHYFGEDGGRKTGDITIEFADDNAIFTSTNNGAKRGLSKKKIYHNGILCKASSDIKYAIAVEGDGKKDGKVTVYSLSPAELAKGSTKYGYVRVVTSTGAKAVKDGDSAVKKDADGNYWIIANGTFRYVSSAELKYSNFSGWVNLGGTYTYKVSNGKVFQFKGTVAEKFYADSAKTTVASNSANTVAQAVSGTKDGWVPFADGDFANAKDETGKVMKLEDPANSSNVVEIKKDYLTNLQTTNLSWN